MSVSLTKRSPKAITAQDLSDVANGDFADSQERQMRAAIKAAHKSGDYAKADRIATFYD